ncbi:MAG: hypothetical protein ACYC57_10530 [Thermoleophilia bacterium]
MRTITGSIRCLSAAGLVLVKTVINSPSIAFAIKQNSKSKGFHPGLYYVGVKFQRTVDHQRGGLIEAVVYLVDLKDFGDVVLLV